MSSSARPSSVRRTFVASDFHLHALEAETPAGREFAQLVRSAAQDGELDVVLAGDIYDLAVSGATPIAHRLGEIIAQHPTLHDTLRWLIERGNRVTLIPGNHDYELASAEAMAVLAASVPGIVVQPWFMRIGDVHIEHGSQYDPDNAHPHALAPHGDPLGIMLTRELLHRLGDLRLLDLNGSTPLVMLAHCFIKYGLKTPGMVARYFALGLRHTLWPRRLDAAYSDAVAVAAAQFSREHGVAESTLTALAQLSAEPTHCAPRALFRRMYLDRMLFGLALGAAVALTAAWAPWGYTALLATFVFIAGVPLGMYQNRYTGQAQSLLAVAAERVALVTEASTVVFGHAHAERDTRRYINPGSFAFPAQARRRGLVEITSRGARLRHATDGVIEALGPSEARRSQRALYRFAQSKSALGGRRGAQQGKAGLRR